MIQSFTPNEQDGWTQTLAAVGRYFDRVLEDPQLPPAPSVGLWEEIPEPFLGIIEGVHLQTVRLLGERTAEMHLALAQDTESPNFAPEPFSLQHQRSVFQSIRSETKQTFALLDANSWHSGRACQKLSGRGPSARRRIRDFSRLPSSRSRSIPRKSGFTGITIWVSFCSPGRTLSSWILKVSPGRPIGERRLKRSALIDVAGMLRSFNYAAHHGLLESRTVRPVDQPTLETYADLWSTRASQVFSEGLS